MKMLRRDSNLTVTVVFAALLFFVSAVPPAASQAPEQSRVESNVIYGMYSGLALLLDVHRPVQANGRGILFVPGSGWATSPDLGAKPIKNDAGQLRLFVAPLVSAGYTVFVINHRVAPQFHY